MLKKEKYWTIKNIDEVSKNFLNEVSKNVRIKNYKELPNHSALLVIDMQDYFLSENSHAFVPSSTAIIHKIIKLIEYFDKKNMLIIETRHINNKSNSGMMNKWWQDTIKKSDNASKINKSILCKNAITIEKSQYDPFYKTKLLDILKKNNINTLIISGVITNLCCETAVRSAFVNGFNTIFPVDTTATYNSAFHLASFINLAYGFTIPVLSKEILKD